jgi:hypothetical protein
VQRPDAPSLEPARRDPLLFKTAQRHNWAMDPQPGSTDGQTSRSFPAPGVDAQITSQIMLAEYSGSRCYGPSAC